MDLDRFVIRLMRLEKMVLDTWRKLDREHGELALKASRLRVGCMILIEDPAASVPCSMPLEWLMEALVPSYAVAHSREFGKPSGPCGAKIFKGVISLWGVSQARLAADGEDAFERWKAELLAQAEEYPRRCAIYAAEAALFDRAREKVAAYNQSTGRSGALRGLGY